MQEAIKNRDFTFRLPTSNLLPGERALIDALNNLGTTIRQQINQNEVESWEKLTRILTHEIMNATAPIMSISESLLRRTDVVNTPLEDGIQAIYDTAQHMSDFVTNYRKMSKLEKPNINDVCINKTIDDIRKSYPQLSWTINIPEQTIVRADNSMLRQILINLIKNALEANATKITIKASDHQTKENISLIIGNDGMPIPAENKQALFIPFFTTKRNGCGIGLSLSRQMMIQQGGLLEYSEKHELPLPVEFKLSLPISKSNN